MKKGENKKRTSQSKVNQASTAVNKAFNIWMDRYASQSDNNKQLGSVVDGCKFLKYTTLALHESYRNQDGIPVNKVLLFWSLNLNSYRHD